MKTWLISTLSGLSALTIAAVLLFLASFAFSSTDRSEIDPRPKINKTLEARGSGRGEETIEISSSDSDTNPDTNPKKKKPNTEIASGEGQTTHKDATDPPRSGENRTD